MSKDDAHYTVAERREAWEKAEADMHAVVRDYDDKRQKLADKYKPRLAKLAEDAALLQKAYCDAEAAEALKDRPDGDAVAAALGLSFD